MIILPHVVLLVLHGTHLTDDETMMAFRDDLLAFSPATDDSVRQCIVTYLGLVTTFLLICVYLHSPRWVNFFFSSLPRKCASLYDYFEDCCEDLGRHMDCRRGSMFVCPKRRQRFRKCARRCQQRRNARQACEQQQQQQASSEQGNAEEPDSSSCPSSEMPCPFEQWASMFCKMHMPPPLPFRQRRKKGCSASSAKSAQNLMPTQSENNKRPTTQEPSDQEEERPRTNAGRQESSSSASSSTTSSTCISSSSLSSTSTSTTSSASTTAPPSPSSSSPAQPTTATTPPSRSSLMDLVRMQQWTTILSQRGQSNSTLLRRRQAKYRDVDGLYPLHWACSGGPPVAIVQALLDCYPSAARKVDREVSTPLHFATHYGASVEVIQALLNAYPAAIGIQDKYGRTPLYHAVDKSARLDVLQALVRADPTQLTTPCLPVPLRGQVIPLVMSEDSSSSIPPLPRAVAKRTPLYLAWGTVMTDYRTRQTCRGKLWDKAEWLLQQAATTATADTTTRQDHHGGVGLDPQEVIVANAIVMDLFLPETVLPLVVQYHVSQLAQKHQQQDAGTMTRPGQHALALAARTRQYSSERSQQVLNCLLQAYPHAAAARNEQGQSMLSLAVAAGKTWNQHGVADLFAAAPDATQWRDRVTGLPPALVAAATRCTTTLLRQNQDSSNAAQHSSVSTASSAASIPNATTELEQLLEASDPYHLLTRKRQQLLEKRRRLQQERQQQKDELSGAASGEQYLLDTETQQLETIYQLLKADPTAATVMALSSSSS